MYSQHHQFIAQYFWVVYYIATKLAMEGEGNLAIQARATISVTSVQQT